MFEKKSLKCVATFTLSMHSSFPVSRLMLLSFVLHFVDEQPLSKFAMVCLGRFLFSFTTFI